MTKRNAPRSRWWQQTREQADLRQHAAGVAAALGYAVLIVVVAAVLALAASLVFPADARAQEGTRELRTSSELISEARELDGETVVYEGEAIGEALERGRFAWVNTNDGKNAIGIWMTNADVRKVSRFGDYRNNGDFIRVTGTFHRACREHGGDLDIHASEVDVLRAGSARPHPIAGAKVAAAAAALLLLGVSALGYRSRRKVQRSDVSRD